MVAAEGRPFTAGIAVRDRRPVWNGGPRPAKSCAGGPV